VHNVWATDLLVCIDDQDALEGLQLLEEGREYLETEGMSADTLSAWRGVFGISGVCNVLAAIKTARYFGLGPKDAIVTVATDGFDRYPSVLRRLTEEVGPMGRDEARRRLAIFRNQKMDHVLEATRETRRRWHNQKYFTWVEQQGKTIDDLRSQEDPAFWIAHQERASVIDRRIREMRGWGIAA
jgi:cysteine synthase